MVQAIGKSSGHGVKKIITLNKNVLIFKRNFTFFFPNVKLNIILKDGKKWKENTLIVKQSEGVSAAGNLRKTQCISHLGENANSTKTISNKPGWLFKFKTSKSEELSKIRKWPYLGQMANNEKDKGTVLSSTLKVKANKVSLF